MHSLSQPRTLLLTERRPHVAHLAPADVAYLLAHHRRHVEVLPTDRRDRYRITALGCAGVLTTPACRFVIQPKIPLANLFALLDPLAELPAGRDSIAPQTGTETLEFLAGQLARRMAERVAAGLHRAYRECREQGTMLHGRLDLPSQLRQAAGRKDQLHSQYDELTPDVPCNQAVKACAECLLASPLLSAEVCAALRQTLVGFEAVSSVPLSPRIWETVEMERWPAEYRPLLDLSRLLAESLTLGYAAGATPAPSFLLDLEGVFERHVTRGIIDAFARSRNHRVVVQMNHTVNHPIPDQPDVTMRPDLTIERGGQTVLVVDAKWKRWTGSAESTDLHQVLAYGMALGAEGVVLVYPGKRWRCQEYRFTHTPLRLTMYTLRVSGPREVCVRAVRRLACVLKLKLLRRA
jgi:5-methylcytosine-specific restriction endonuclease McrBC regulatory subunit McrC